MAMIAAAQIEGDHGDEDEEDYRLGGHESD